MAAVGNVFYTFVPQKYSSGNVSDYTKSGDQEIDGLTWTVPGNWYASGALRIGGKSIENVDRVIAGKTAMGDAIAKIVIAHAGVTSDNLKLNSVKVTVAKDADFTQDVTETVAVAETDFTVAKNTEGTIELTPKDADFWAKDAYYKFAFNVTNTNGSNYAFVLNKIEFYSYSDVEITHWTVAGSSATLFGTTWDPANKDNEMIQQEDGSFKWEKTELELAEGTIAFKVCKNYTWDEAYPAKDYELAIPGAGIYTVTINFNPESKEIAAVADKTGEAVVLPTVVLHGNFFGEWKDTDPFAPAEDKLTARLNLTLAEGNYEFGFKFDGAWKANGAHITREAPTTSLAEGSGNMHFAADAAGEYQLTYTFESQTLEVVYPKKPEVLPEGAFKLTFNGTGEAGKDASAALAAEVEAIFDAASAPYVASVQEATKVYAGRPIDDDNSSLKFGTSSAAGSLAFTLATPVEVDSIIVNATQYGNDAAEVTVNGVKFDLTAGNKVPTDCKLVPNGEISQITIAQTGSQRIYVRSVKVFPKAGPVPPVDEPKFYVTGGEDIVGEGKATWAKEGALVSYKDTLELNLAAGYHELKLITPDDQWLGYNELSGEIPAGITTNEWTNIIFTLNEAGIVKVIYIAGDPRVFTLEGNFSTDVPVVLPVVAIAGAMNEWSADANILGPEEGDEKASAKIALEAQDYNFKVVVDGQWRCYKGQVYDITRENATLPGINEEGGYDDNFNLKADVAGEYTFTWIYATNTLEITFPEGPVPPVDEPKFYITGTANLVGEESAWQPNALPVKEESAVLSLEPGAYMMKITLKGNWTEGVLGFDELTGEIPEGVTRGKDGDDNNICFTLAEAGDVTVTYTGEVFTIAGNFYVEPAGDPTVTVIGDMTEWAAEIPFILSEDKKTATLYNDNIKAGTYAFKLKVNGEWRSNGYTFHRDFTSAEGITENVEANMVVIIDVEGEYTFTWTFETNKLEITFPEKGEGIEEILSEGKAVKVIREGNLIILKGDKAYNAMGQIVK